MSLNRDLIKMAELARDASQRMVSLRKETKNKALRKMASAIVRAKSLIIKANRKDIKNAERKKLSPAMIERLILTEKRVHEMSRSISEVSLIKDPVGAVAEFIRRPNGLLIGKMRVPIGVMLVIYESRPNVTADCAALALKSGNALILRGGKEAINSNIAIFNVLAGAAEKAGIPKGAINMVKSVDRRGVSTLLGLSGLIDLVIPRGGESLIREIASHSKIPVIKHYKGVCHVFVDDEADLNMAEKIAYNAKVQRPGVCNAMETLLVHEDIACRFLPSLAKRLIAAGVELRGCRKTKRILRNFRVKSAKETDWREEYLELILSVKVVKNLDEAIRHINKYGTSHSDAIVTESCENAMEFLEKVDSSAVYVNASTRFTDGNQFGKGAEIGISTDKLHARGPVGAEDLTTYKYVIFGNGQVRK